MKPHMIYHAPYPIVENASKASAIRPAKMREAFADAGYEVVDVTGFAKERARKIAEVKKRIRAGERFDFCYSESATIPTSLTEPRHLPPHPFLDALFFRFLKRSGIKSGLFYRDIYWKGSDYLGSLPRPLGRMMQGAFVWDLAWYRLFVNTLYLPSMNMGNVVPIFPKNRMRALPPGLVEVDCPPKESGPLTILYVGAVGSHYRIHSLLEAVRNRPEVRLIICTHKELWNKERAEYEGLLGSNIEIVHESGAGLEKLYERADVCSLVMEPAPYREFASPVKLYEYLGHAKPVLATEGTLAGQVASDGGWGLCVDYTPDAIGQALDDLREHGVAKYADAARAARKDHTWLARAKQVAAELTR